MELRTFGAVFTFAIQLEEATMKFYEDATGIIESNIAKKLVTSLGNGAKKRKRKVERTRQELVREMILIYVTDLKQSDYLVKTGSIQDTNTQHLLEKALELEKNNQRYYTDASIKIGHPDIDRIFKRLAKENASNQLQLEALQNTISEV